MSDRLRATDWNRLGWVAAIAAAAAMVGASFILQGGDDLYRFYRPFSEGCLECGFVPYFARWILWPLSLIPAEFAWSLWSGLNLALLLGFCHWTGVNPALVILSFPAFGQFWLGQIDSIVCLGLLVALLARNPYARGLGIALALVKPQLAGLAIFYLLTREKNLLKVLIVPAAVFAASLAVFGLDWPLEWLAKVLSELPVHVWRLASRDLWPYGAFLALVPLLLRDRSARFEAGLLASALATPFFGVYSYVVLLVFRAKWWSLPLSYIWILAYPWLGSFSMRLAWVLPAGLLVHLLVENLADLRRGASPDGPGAIAG